MVATLPQVDFGAMLPHPVKNREQEKFYFIQKDRAEINKT